MNIKEIISKMTLEEKASLCSGSDFWHTEAIERLGIPAMMMCDGPHGLRKQSETTDNMGINDSIEAVCFPAGCATAASFDRSLVERMGQALGRECQAENIGVLLGPAVNIKRSPLCGRNFEYYSEDPYVVGEMAKSFIKGVQSQNVGVSVKHFYANNQEHRRMSSSSNMDERTAREIYLPAFEAAVKEVQPWTVMCSYNRINGVYAAENKDALTDILRKEFGFEGAVISDWGAVSNRVAGLKAGMDLEMPSSGGVRDVEIVQAVKEKKLSEAVLDATVERILTLVDRYQRGRKANSTFDKAADHALSREIASQCMVLLKNEGKILPLHPKKQAAFIGLFATEPRFQGGGSSHVHAYKVESAFEAAKALGYPVRYAKGYDTAEDITYPTLISDAVRAAKNAEVAVVFAGLPDTFESEGYDRKHMKMPQCQNALISAVAQANPNTVVVLHNGSPVEMPWIDEVKGVVEAYLGGQAVGAATVDVLYGAVNPSGHLAETFPLKLEDNPSYLYYGGEGDEADYREGVFVGYRYYSKKKMEVLFPFGHGLSYTTFAISNLRTEEKVSSVQVSVEVTNTGKIAGREVVQIYVMPQLTTDAVIRPSQELKAFKKVLLQPGETKTLQFTLEQRAFAYYDNKKQAWTVEDGNYTIAAGNSAANLTAMQTLHVSGEVPKPEKITLDTTFGDLFHSKKATELLKPYIKIFVPETAEAGSLGEGTAEMLEAQLYYMPIRNLISFGGGKFTTADCEKLVAQLNALL